MMHYICVLASYPLYTFHVPLLFPATPPHPLHLPRTPHSPLARLRAMRREAKVAELKVLDDARQRFLQHQKTAKEIELQRLDDEIKRRVGAGVGGAGVSEGVRGLLVNQFCGSPIHSFNSSLHTQRVLQLGSGLLDKFINAEHG